MRERDAHIHGRVLECLRDGVLVVSLGGTIAILNPAASRILAVDAPCAQERAGVAKAPGRGKHRRRRERAPLRGMMLHQDGSTHEWVPGQHWDLVITLDDATSEHYSMFFVEEEGTASSFQGMGEVIERWGLPSSLYTDRGSHYCEPRRVFRRPFRLSHAARAECSRWRWYVASASARGRFPMGSRSRRWLSNPKRAMIVDGEAVGTIRNSDPMPRAWLARFGRTVESQVVDALTQRLEGASGSHVTVAGINVIGAQVEEPALTDDDPFGLPEWAKNAEREADAQSITGDDILLRSAFHVSSARDGAQGGGSAFTAWGRVATGGFETEEDGVTMDGDVTTGLVGFDAEWEHALAGVMLSQSSGDGAYRRDAALGDDAGTVESSLTGVYPYARLDLNGRVSTWALAGAGSGDLTLHQEGGKPMPTDITLRMGAVGVGRTGSAAGRLWSARDARGLGADSEFEAASRLEMDAGYGFGLRHGRGVLTPYAGLTLGDGGNRTVRTGARWQLTPDAVVGVEATRQASDAGKGANEVNLRAGLRF